MVLSSKVDSWGKYLRCSPLWSNIATPRPIIIISICAEHRLELQNTVMLGWKIWYRVIMIHNCLFCSHYSMWNESFRIVLILFQPCNNPACLYLHSIGADEDSFGKDEVAAVHTRYHVTCSTFFLFSLPHVIFLFSAFVRSVLKGKIYIFLHLDEQVHASSNKLQFLVTDI